MLTGAESYLKTKVEQKQFVTFFPQNRALCLEEAALEDDLAKRGDDNLERAVSMADLESMKSTFLAALDDMSRAMKKHEGDSGSFGEDSPDTFRAARLARRAGGVDDGSAASAPKKAIGLKGVMKKVSTLSTASLGK